MLGPTKPQEDPSNGYDSGSDDDDPPNNHYRDTADLAGHLLRRQGLPESCRLWPRCSWEVSKKKNHYHHRQTSHNPSSVPPFRHHYADSTLNSKLSLCPPGTETSILWADRLLRSMFSHESRPVTKRLGAVVLQRLTGSAETWYYSLLDSYRSDIEVSWDTLKLAIFRFRHRDHSWRSYGFRPSYLEYPAYHSFL